MVVACRMSHVPHEVLVRHQRIAKCTYILQYISAALSTASANELPV